MRQVCSCAISSGASLAANAARRDRSARVRSPH
jgi:hypothetical protein